MNVTLSDVCVGLPGSGWNSFDVTLPLAKPDEIQRLIARIEAGVEAQARMPTPPIGFPLSGSCADREAPADPGGTDPILLDPHVARLALIRLRERLEELKDNAQRILMQRSATNHWRAVNLEPTTLTREQIAQADAFRREFDAERASGEAQRNADEMKFRRETGYTPLDLDALKKKRP